MIRRRRSRSGQERGMKWDSRQVDSVFYLASIDDPLLFLT